MPRPVCHTIDMDYAGAGDDLGALDDLLKSPKRAWWRNL